MAIACVTHRLPAGAVRLTVRVMNSTAVPRDAILYGPAVALVRHEYPVLRTRQVTVRDGGRTIPYVGLVVPRIKAHGTARVLLRLGRHRGTTTLSVTGTRLERSPGQSGTTCSIGSR